MERALRDFSLIGGVGGEEFAALDEVLYDAGGIVVVATGTGEADELLRGERACQLLEEEAQVGLGECVGQVVVALEAGRLGHIGEEVVDG